MSAEENRKRIQELRWVGFQRLLAGIAIIFGVSCVFFIFLDEQAGSRPHYSYSSGKALGLLLFAGVWGLWNIVRGIIYLIRAQSGDEHYAKKVVDTMDKVESKQEEVMGNNAAIRFLISASGIDRLCFE